MIRNIIGIYVPGRVNARKRTGGFGRISEIFNAFHAFRVNHFICATYYTLPCGKQEEKSAYPILFHGVAPRAIKSIAPLLFPSGRSENAFLTSRFRDPFYFGAIWNCDISLRYFL